MIARVHHPRRGEFKIVGCPIVMSASPVEMTSSPLLGAHTQEILQELGYAPDYVETLQQMGVI